jgi:phosphoglycerate dehydrogenase-like enzyme
MTGMRILMTGQTLSDEEENALRDVAMGACIDIRPRLDLGVDEDRAVLAAAEVIAGALDDDQVPVATALRWNHLWTAGADTLPASLTRSSVRVTSSAGNGAVPLAEHAMMLMLMLDRDAPRALRAQQSAEWDRFRHGELAGSTLGIIGLGNAGRELARRASAFTMRVLGVRNRPEIPVDGVDRIFGPDGLALMLPECDFVVVTAPLTGKTRGLMGEAQFKAMKSSAYYVCVSRGAVADQPALLRALEERWIAGAALDAHDVEPLPADSPFWSLPGVIVTPHHGATTWRTPHRGFEIFLGNLRRYLAGRELVNVIDRAAGY